MKQFYYVQRVTAMLLVDHQSTIDDGHFGLYRHCDLRIYRTDRLIYVAEIRVVVSCCYLKFHNTGPTHSHSDAHHRVSRENP